MNNGQTEIESQPVTSEKNIKYDWTAEDGLESVHKRHVAQNECSISLEQLDLRLRFEAMTFE